MISSIGFDLTQKNIFEPLISGGLLIFGGRQPNDLNEMEAAIRRYRPTRVNCAPSAFQALRGLLVCDSLRVVVLGGEPVSARLAREIAERGARFVNSYGPTECSDVALYYAGFAPGDQFVPLGRPIPNVETFLVDEDMSVVDGAGVGELLIGGVGVGRGYVGRDDLTAERFVTGTLGHYAGRFYRTGDVVRRTDDGTLLYVSRGGLTRSDRFLRFLSGTSEAIMLPI